VTSSRLFFVRDQGWKDKRRRSAAR